MRSLSRSGSFATVALAALTLGACASIMHGSTQEVSIASAPTGARVLVDGVDAGVTPFLADLKRKDKHVIRIEMEGYEPFELPLRRSTSGWVWGNLVFGGLPGLAIDAITGGLYKLEPTQVSASLAAKGVSMANGRDYLVVAVVLAPEAGWEKVGDLSAR